MQLKMATIAQLQEHRNLVKVGGGGGGGQN